MKQISINNINIGTEPPPFIFAEAGINHNSELDATYKIIEVAKKSGANPVGMMITKPEDHQLLDKYFPHEIWDYYNPNNHKYEQWKRSEWRQYTK